MTENKIIYCKRCKKLIEQGETYWLVETEDGLEHPFCEQCHEETFMPDKGRKVVNND